MVDEIDFENHHFFKL